MTSRDGLSHVTHSRRSMRSNKLTTKPPIAKESVSSIEKHLNTLDAYTQGADINRIPNVQQEYSNSGQLSVKSMSHLEPNKLNTNAVSRSAIGSQIRMSQRDSKISTSMAEPKNNLLSKPKSVFQEAKTKRLNAASDEEIKDEVFENLATVKVAQSADLIEKDSLASPQIAVEIDDDDYSDDYEDND